MGSLTEIIISVFFMFALVLITLILSISAILGYVLVDRRKPRAQYVNPDGKPVILLHSDAAIDPTFEQLVEFLRNDQTEKLKYIPGKFVCSNFAETLQHNATRVGYRCGWVAINFSHGAPSHSCNAFNTSDRGLIFVDCIGNDSIVDISPKKIYQPQSIIDDTKCEAMGEVSSYRIIW